MDRKTGSGHIARPSSPHDLAAVGTCSYVLTDASDGACSGTSLGRDEPVQAGAWSHRLDLCRAGDLRQERSQRILPGYAPTRGNEKAEPLLVVHGFTDDLLLTQQRNRDLLQLAPAQVTVKGAERELRRNPERFVDLLEQANGLLNVRVQMIDETVKSLRLSAQLGHPSSDHVSLRLDAPSHVLRKSNRRHASDCTTGCGRPD